MPSGLVAAGCEACEPTAIDSVAVGVDVVVVVEFGGHVIATAWVAVSYDTCVVPTLMGSAVLHGTPLMAYSISSTGSPHSSIQGRPFGPIAVFVPAGSGRISTTSWEATDCHATPAACES